MLTSQIVTVSRKNGEIQRAHIIRADNWKDVCFTRPRPEPGAAFSRLVSLYRNHHIIHYPFLYGRNVFFRLPDGVSLPGEDKREQLTYAARIFKKGLTVHNGEPCFLTAEAKTLYEQLDRNHCIEIACGSRKRTYILPVADECGFLSSCAPEHGAAVNLSFFLMDPLDCATEHDHIGMPVGLRVRDGIIESLPQFQRPMLLVKKNGTVLVTDDPEDARVDPLRVEYRGRRIVLTDEHVHMFKEHVEKGFILSGDRIVSTANKRRVTVPTSGFTAAFEDPSAPLSDATPGDRVDILGMTDILFGIQVGPAAVIDGKAQMGAPAHFYKIKQLLRNILTLTAPYPPAMYRCDPERDRAPRVVLGADGEGKPLLVWLEGAAKAHHIPGQDSCGATLNEAASFCAEQGMKNGIHLDGGGSAQILLNRKRELMISDRDPQTGEEAERAIPNGMIIR